MGGMATTLKVLAETANDAAAPVLVAAISSSDRDLRDLALPALLCRRNDAAELAVLQSWNDFSARWRTQIAERGGWLSSAIRRAVLGVDTGLYDCGCAAALFTRDFDLLPVLAGAAADWSNPHRAKAAAATLELAELLAEELATPRDYRVRRDPQMQRHHVLPSLERAVVHFDEHRCRELLEAFALLAPRENAALKRVLQAPSDRSFAPLVEVLASSSRPGVQRLLLSYLDDPYAPLAAVQIAGRRCDVSFLRQAARKIGADPAPVVRANLRRIENIPWITSNIGLLDALSEAEQPGVLHLAAGSCIPRHHALEVAAYILRHGSVTGRRMAARILAGFGGPEATALVVAGLEDEDPHVRAALAAQLRERSVPGAIPTLLRLLESPHETEREAARSSLAEFRFSRFLADFDNLSEEARRSTGPLVRQIDPASLDELRTELEAPARSRRRRALLMAVAMDAIALLHQSIAALLKDDDQFLRIEAIGVLAHCDSQRTRLALREALLDTHVLVQDAAEAALARLAQSDTVSAQAALRDTKPNEPSGEPAPPAQTSPESAPIATSTEVWSSTFAAEARS